MGDQPQQEGVFLEFAFPATPQAMIDRTRTYLRWDPPETPILSVINFVVAFGLLLNGQLLAGAIVFAAAVLFIIEARWLLYEAWIYKRRFSETGGTIWSFRVVASGIAAASKACQSFVPWQYMATIIFSKTTMIVLDEGRAICSSIPLDALTPDQVSTLRRVVPERAKNAQIVIQS
jgi:hypothetical protein